MPSLRRATSGVALLVDARLACAVLVWTLVLWAPRVAHAGVDHEVRPNAKVKGSIAPVGEIDVFRFDATRGALLSLSLKAKGSKDLDFDLVLTGPGDVDVPLATAPVFQDKGSRVKVKKLPLTATGRYVLEVKGSGTGEYALSLKATPQKTWSGELALAAAGSAQFPLAAPTGATLVVKARAAAGSGALPSIGGTGQIAAKTGSASLKIPSLDAGGEVFVRVDDEGQSGGAVNVTVKVTAKGKPEKLDVRGKSLDNPGGGETSVAATVSAADGGAVAVVDPLSPLDGAGVALPPGALAVDTLITLNSTAQIDVPDAATQQPAGPAVEFGPEGLAFSAPADVTVPIDLSALPAGSDPDDVVSVQKTDADGNTQTTDPGEVDVDLAAGTATVAASGFSTFMAFVPKGPPQLTGRSYWLAFLEAELVQDFGGFDSRRRAFFQGAGTAVFGKEGPGGALTFNITERTLVLDHADDGTRSITSEERFETETGTWTYDPGGRTITTMTDSQDQNDTAPFFVAEDGSALLYAVEDLAFDPVVFTDMLLERPATNYTHDDLAGTWFLGGLELSFGEQATGGPAPVSAMRLFGTVEMRRNGSASTDVDLTITAFDPPTGQFQTTRARERDSGSITLVDERDPDFPLSVLFAFDRSPGEPLRFLPSAKLDVMIGFPEDADDLDEFGNVFILTRAGAGLDTGDLRGEYGGVSLLVDGFATYDVPGLGNPVTIGDLLFANVRELRVLDLPGVVQYRDIAERVVRRNPQNQQNGGVDAALFVGTEPDDTLVIKKDGSFRIPARNVEEPDLVGAFTPDTIFFFGVEDPRGDGIPGFDLSIRLPPASPGAK